MFQIIIITIAFSVTTVVSLPMHRCSHIEPDVNACTLIDLHYNKTHFQFNSFYGFSTVKIHVINSTLPKLGKFGLCLPKYSTVDTITNVEEIDLTDVKLEELTSDVFENCAHLKILILRGNKLETLENVFSKNRELEKLDLTNNLIKSVSDEVFADMTQLKDLSLSGNHLIQFLPTLIETCSNLEVLRLDSNDLFDLNAKKIMEHAPKLRTLAYNNNQMRCGRMKDLDMKFKAKAILVDYSYEEEIRERIQPPETVGSIICLGDMPWSAAHYVYTYNKITEEF